MRTLVSKFALSVRFLMQALAHVMITVSNTLELLLGWGRLASIPAGG